MSEAVLTWKLIFLDPLSSATLFKIVRSRQVSNIPPPLVRAHSEKISLKLLICDLKVAKGEVFSILNDQLYLKSIFLRSLYLTRYLKVLVT